MNHSNLMDFWQHIERYLGFKVFWGWKQADKWLTLSESHCIAFFVPWDRLVLLGIAHQSPHLWLCSSLLICLHELCKWFELKRFPLYHFHWIKRFATLHFTTFVFVEYGSIPADVLPAHLWLCNCPQFQDLSCHSATCSLQTVPQTHSKVNKEFLNIIVGVCLI